MRPNLASVRRFARPGGMLAGTLAIADTAHAAGDAGEAKLPQLDITSYPSQIFWLVIIFIVLYFLVSKVAVPKISEVLDERRKRLADDLDKAESLKIQAEQISAEYEQSLREARDKAHSITRNALDAIASSNAAHEKQERERLALMLQEAESRIATAQAAAIGNVESIACDIASDAMAKLIDTRPPPGAVIQAVTASMAGQNR